MSKSILLLKGKKKCAKNKSVRIKMHLFYETCYHSENVVLRGQYIKRHRPTTHKITTVTPLGIDNLCKWVCEDETLLKRSRGNTLYLWHGHRLVSVTFRSQQWRDFWSQRKRKARVETPLNIVPVVALPYISNGDVVPVALAAELGGRGRETGPHKFKH
jgi:hypothetical protein